jgi:protein phosphatase 2C-like protein
MRFEWAAGTITGTSHVRVARNGQDGFAILREGEKTVAVVTDGCGSAPHSEVGAKLGAQVAARALLDGTPDSILPRIRAIAELLALPNAMNDYFLFTIVAAIITPDETTIVSAGDGLFAVNGDIHIIGPYPDNAPPYLGYGDTALSVEYRGPTAGVQTLLLATDGATRIAGDLAPFWTDALMFRNPDAVRRRLFLRRAQLDDDTTVIVLRRAA